MPSPFVKSQIADVIVMVILAVFAALLWLDLSLIREEVGAMQQEREYLTLRVEEIRRDADIWFPTREESLAFGVRNLKMEILSN